MRLKSLFFNIKFSELIWKLLTNHYLASDYKNKPLNNGKSST